MAISQVDLRTCLLVLVYIKALTVFSHTHNPYGVNTLLSQGYVLASVSTVGTVGKMYSPSTGVGEEPLLQSSWWSTSSLVLSGTSSSSSFCWLHLVFIYVLGDVLNALVMFVVTF